MADQGWYSDPQNANQDRWWDGTQWTGQTRPSAGGQPGFVHGGYGAPNQNEQGFGQGGPGQGGFGGPGQGSCGFGGDSGGKNRSGGRTPWIIGGTALVLVAALLLWFLVIAPGRKDDASSSESTSSSTSSSSAPSEQPSQSEEASQGERSSQAESQSRGETVPAASGSPVPLPASCPGGGALRPGQTTRAIQSQYLRAPLDDGWDRFTWKIPFMTNAQVVSHKAAPEWVSVLAVGEVSTKDFGTAEQAGSTVFGCLAADPTAYGAEARPSARISTTNTPVEVGGKTGYRSFGQIQANSNSGSPMRDLVTIIVVDTGHSGSLSVFIGIAYEPDVDLIAAVESASRSLTVVG